jgi:hypothetical protein
VRTSEFKIPGTAGNRTKEVQQHPSLVIVASEEAYKTK